MSSLSLFFVGLCLFISKATSSRCSPDDLAYPSLFGGAILSFSASPVLNYTASPDFCNITILYTHPGQNDTITVSVWLPLEDWNQRFLGVGGGGFSMTMGPEDMATSVAENYAVVATDGGHSFSSDGFLSAASWALASPGNVNLYLLNDFASVALEEAAIIGKAITTAFYGSPPQFSYFRGCSTGGRQGLMLAQRYPKAYDGILAIAPGINWAKFLVAEYWPQFVMNQLKTYPPKCVFDAITAAAVDACDGIDGVVDGVISLPKECTFDPRDIVGQVVQCGNVTATISDDAAIIAEKAWAGPRSVDGSFQWYGLHKGASFNELIGTKCSEAYENCRGTPFPIADEWIRLFLTGEPGFNLTNITHAEYDAFFKSSHQRYQSIISTDDSDLSAFQRSGGKMITWHGLADSVIPPDGTVQYYEEVLRRDPKAADYYRFFEAPGVGHCYGGAGAFPATAFKSLVAWVEEEKAPETLRASIDLAGTNETRERDLCLYPLVSSYTGGDPLKASSYLCT